jgi:hypothetical protein
MPVPSWLRWLTAEFSRNRNGRTRRPQPSSARRCASLTIEYLEDRTLPSNYTAASLADLIADINAANAVGGANTIMLVAGTTFTLTAANNTSDGATGLPVIATNDNLTIAGNGDTIARSTQNGIPAFRLLDVAAGGSLTLTNLTLQGGLAFGGGVSAQGGALYNQGTLLLIGVTVQNNTAQGSDGQYISSQTGSAPQSAAGGGIYSSGTLTLQGCTIQNNQALGGQGASTPQGGQWGGDGFGGGLYVAGGTASLSNVSLNSNTAQGGNGGDGLDSFDLGRKVGSNGGNGGNGFGGGLYAAGGTVSLRNTTVTHNNAKGGGAGSSGPGASHAGAGQGEGGGLYLAAGAAVCLDAFTQANVSHNNASTSDNNIHGPYTTCP